MTNEQWGQMQREDLEQIRADIREMIARLDRLIAQNRRSKAEIEN